jgi:hypothetical protein
MASRREETAKKSLKTAKEKKEKEKKTVLKK